MFDALTEDERLALSAKLSSGSSKLCEVGHTLAAVALSTRTFSGELWDRRGPYVEAMYELHVLRKEVAV